MKKIKCECGFEYTIFFGKPDIVCECGRELKYE